ncbi:response regulator [uncultured Algimonas sp.]|uniref:response regulator n=1 Tax=uncultured Algimonas sp. TaxID=1547920 RepID=UPI002612742F|nr:response regulator [uncultured Algimonas sp.]
MATLEVTKKQQVLIVEDDAFIALDIESVMDAAGFDVIGCAGRVDEALDLLDRHAPDIVLLDFNLRDETSIPIAKLLQKTGIPFLFISGQTREVVLADMADDYKVIPKPFRPKHLVNNVRSLTQH